MPNAQCPMPNAQYPMPNAPNIFVKLTVNFLVVGLITKTTNNFI
ncbi:hypothetical protein [Nostoc sp. NMS7]|nr:hypothetical protein [Nostoc sp. NMS7]